ncbi:hypothetical protein KR52_04970 [Synechococcus sp. KORDI-52]|uniref:sulfotransferase domain-containing protein n=1 Tax=Synechococcus sp. KORDI-52 TaxID=585425 RepID=UPI0004E084AD|nr:sulfotransferase domain-containing protein [Synechococcus sp. KORDI-52]AII48496.1 hypothetical protein KR52_04970 [Synechococcus sp. KORDI-52]
MASGADRSSWLERWRCQRQIHHSLQGHHDRIAEVYRTQLPNFIIIGAAKSATTSLATALKRHPEIQISRSMEPKFFGRNYLRGWEWYANQFAADPQRPLRGEASTMYSSSYGSYIRTPELIRHHLGPIPLIYLVRHPLRRIESHWRHWHGRIKDCPAFDQLLRSPRLRQRVVDASLYHQQWKRYRRWFPLQSMLSITTEELSAHPQTSLHRILRFIGATPDSSGLLERGELPLMNPAGSKGRRDVATPTWSDELKQQTIDLIRPDSERFLKATGRPGNTWSWD